MRRPERFVIALALALFLTGLARDGFDHWIDSTALPALQSETSVEMHDSEGRILRVYTVDDGRWRLGASRDVVDPVYIEMLLGYEDRRFFRHAGVDPLAMLRAVWQAALNGRVVSGGSTLSMQVARLLERSGTGKWRGKLRQIRVALALERRLNKERILNLYLTRAPFGGNIEGVRAATLSWFGKEPGRLTPAEAAMLVALPQSPAARRPDRNAAAARAARNRVLARAGRLGLLDDEAVDAALAEPVPEFRRSFPILAPHLTDFARSADPATARQTLTLDARLQRSLETLARDTVRDLPPGVSIAVLVADHRSGGIRASVGSAGFHTGDARHGFVDMTLAHRSPGSTLKPLIYAMAFDRGLAHPQTLIDDRPVDFGGYAPRNFDGTFRGELPVAEALRLSLNIPAVLLMNEIRPAHLVNTMRRSGVQAALPGSRAGLAVALGGVGVTLTDLVQLYAMLANGGEVRSLHWRKDRAVPSGPRVLGRAAAWQVTHILAGLVPPPGAPPGRIAYKTGTSYGHRDTWAVGYDGAHVAGVWIGRPDGTPVPGAFGSDLAAPLLFGVFQRLKEKPDPLPAPPPETLILPNAALPQPLRRFTGRNAVFEPETDAPKLIFPPDGARLPVDAAGLPVKLRDGVPPFTLMANGAPVRTGLRHRETTVGGLSRGYSTLSVIDAAGRSARITFWVD